MTSLSVVVPVRNGAAFLPRAIASIRGEAGSTCEIIVVDDGSTDETPAAAAALARDPMAMIRLLHTDKGSPAAARNLGIAAAGGAWLSFLDVDDLWLPGRTAELARRLAADATLDVAYGKVQVVRDDPEDPIWDTLTIAEEPGIFPLIGAGLYRRRAFERIGGFDESLRFGEDMDWFLRAGEQGLRMVIIDRPVLAYNLHAGNMTRDRGATRGSVAAVLRRSLLRRRQAGQLRPLPQPSDYFERAGTDA